jgi:pimeloyl-ACP methyl ester carboxylesterase
MRMPTWVIIGLFVVATTTAGLLWLYHEAPDIAAAELAAIYGKPPSRYLELPSGTRARYQDHPSENHGASPTILLLHGGNMSLESWASWVERLRGSARIVTVDLPGHGLTGATLEKDYSIAGLVTFVDQFTTALKLDRPFVVAGHSTGGQVAWRFALRRPERIEKLVLVAPGGVAPPGGPQAAAYRIAALPGGALLLRLFASRSRFAAGLRTVFHHKSVVTAEMVDLYFAMSRREGTREATFTRLRSASFDPAMVAHLSDIEAPTLIIWGLNDTVSPVEQSATFTRAIRAARLVTYDGCGHFPMVEFPDPTVSDLRSFLAAASYR